MFGSQFSARNKNILQLLFTDLLSIEDSIAISYDTNAQNILITDDFNMDVLKNLTNTKSLIYVSNSA